MSCGIVGWAGVCRIYIVWHCGDGGCVFCGIVGRMGMCRVA